MVEQFQCMLPSWADMQNYAKQTAEQIKKSGFVPDMIIALSRGGLVPARLFCDFLHIKNCVAIKVDHWGITAAKDGQARISHGLNMDLTGKRILIVDDITDTGQSMELAKKHIEELSPEETKTATLIHLTNSKYVPDFYGHEMDWAWVIFPWNYREDLVNLIGKITKEEEKSADKIKDELKINFGVETEVKEIEEIIEHIKYLNNRK